MTGQLASIACFRGLPDAALDHLARGGRALDLADGTVIFAQGDPADAVFAITGDDGRVRIGSTDPANKSLMVALFGAGDIFGEMGVIDETTRSADAVAIGRVRLWRIEAATFRAVLDSTPALGLALARLMSARLRRTYALLQDATFATVEVRLARQLLYLAGHGGRKTAAGMLIPGRFRQADLADLLGATARSIITVLNAWRAAGVVSYDTNTARMTILDPPALRVLAGLVGTDSTSD